jgi:hypothetical protein
MTLLTLLAGWGEAVEAPPEVEGDVAVRDYTRFAAAIRDYTVYAARLRDYTVYNVSVSDREST